MENLSRNPRSNRLTECIPSPVPSWASSPSRRQEWSQHGELCALTPDRYSECSEEALVRGQSVLGTVPAVNGMCEFHKSWQTRLVSSFVCFKASQEDDSKWQATNRDEHLPP